MGISTTVLFIGGGMAGTAAAHALGARGVEVMLVDTKAVMPPVFKAEKVGPNSLPQLRRLGISGAVEAVGRNLYETIDAADGRVMRRMRLGEYGFYYCDLVNRLRRDLPSTVIFKHGTARSLEVEPEMQKVELVSGEKITSRLVVLSCGPQSHILKQLGIERAPILDEPAIGFGCRLAPVGGDKFWFDGSSVTYYPNDAEPRISYCTLFSVPDGMRLNMFGFQEIKAAWVRELQMDPHGKLTRVFPKLGRLIGDFRIATRLETMPVQVTIAANYRRPGVVLIGDAFSTIPPSTGFGVGKLMHDVEVLVHLVPGWLTTPGMGLEKINAFYDHPQKKEADAHANEKTHYQHWAATSPTLRAQIHRWKLFADAHVKQLAGYTADLPRLG